ncbi:putative delta(8)-fatty-acid desaturase-like [Capsicum annuum]|nr:putative delta(8)-fatty-acid desaturase-like [Capsicum annuum]
MSILSIPRLIVSSVSKIAPRALLSIVAKNESEGSFQYGNYRREADDLRAIVEHFHEEERFIATIVGHSKGGNVVLLYASSYKDVDAVVNISGRFNLERGIEGRLGRDFKEKIKHDGFIDVRNRKDNSSIASILLGTLKSPLNPRGSHIACAFSIR